MTQKGCVFEWEVRWEGLEGFGGGETVVRIYSMKIYFLVKEKKEAIYSLETFVNFPPENK